MGLLYVGDPIFIQAGKEIWPKTDPFELDQLIVNMEGGFDDLDDYLDSLTVGDPADIDENMLLRNWTPSFPRPGVANVQLNYIGAKAGVLPPTKHEDGGGIGSASSSKSMSGSLLVSPITIEFNSPSKTISYFSFGAEGTDFADDPDADPTVKNYTVGDTSVSIGTLIDEIVAQFFSIFIDVPPIQSEEIIPGQYYRNVSTKSKRYVPFIFDLTPGPYASLASPGGGYTAGDTLTVSSGGESATIVVDTVGSVFGSGGGILSYHVTANTFTVAHNLLVASGGTGTGAKFNIFIVS